MAFAHLAWRFLKAPQALRSRVLRQKYLRLRNFRDVEVRPQDSLLWKGIIRQQATIFDNLRWVVGNGTQIRALDDTRVPHFGPLRAHLIPSNGVQNIINHLGRHFDTELMVSDLIDANTTPP